MSSDICLWLSVSLTASVFRATYQLPCLCVSARITGYLRRDEAAALSSDSSVSSLDSHSEYNSEPRCCSTSTSSRLPGLAAATAGAISSCCCCQQHHCSSNSSNFCSCEPGCSSASAADTTAAAAAAGSSSIALDYGVCGICFSADDALLCLADKVSVPRRRGGSRGGPPESLETCQPLDCGVSVFSVALGMRVGDGLHGCLPRAVSLLRPHPVSPSLLLVASYGGDVWLLSLWEAGSVDPRDTTPVNCPPLKRIRLGSQCCWLEGEWGPTGRVAALVHRFGCVSFFACGGHPTH